MAMSYVLVANCFFSQEELNKVTSSSGWECCLLVSKRSRPAAYAVKFKHMPFLKPVKLTNEMNLEKAYITDCLLPKREPHFSKAWCKNTGTSGIVFIEIAKGTD